MILYTFAHMKRSKDLILLVLTLALPVISAAQEEEKWLAYPVEGAGNSGDTLVADSLVVVDSLNFNAENGEITVHEDERIDKLEKFIRSGEESLEGVLIDGYRVLIYFDQNKSKSEQQKAHFLSLYEDHKAYVDYLAPNYRVRVGNFRTRIEAEKLKQELIGLFPTAIVVEDKIQLPVLPSENDLDTDQGDD